MKNQKGVELSGSFQSLSRMEDACRKARDSDHKYYTMFVSQLI